MADQIFISYRRDDAAYVTGHINDRLRREFGDASVLTDVDNLALGVDFRTAIEETVSKCNILLAVIGADWITVRNKDGEHRLHDPGDFVRIEIESALRRNIPVIPLLVGGTKMPTEKQLPESLHNLAFRNGTQIRPAPDFHTDMDRLIKYLREHLQTLQLYSEKGQRIDSEHQTRRQDDRSPTKINPQRERGNENRAVSGSSVQVDEAEKTRKQIELGINPDGPKKGSAGRIFLLMITLVIASGGSWFAWIQYQEQVDATNITLAPAEQAAADAEAKPRAEVNSERSTEAEPATQVVVDADAKAKLAADAEAKLVADAEAKLVADAEAKLVADAEAKLVADAEAKLKADAEAARQAKIDAEAQRRSVAEAERKVDATSLLREGVSLAAFGDYAAAIENYNEAIRLNVQPGFAHKQRGAAHHALGNYQAAIADYSETIRLSPGDANAFYSRSASYFAMQNFEAVISDCDEAIRIEPEYGGAYSNRAAAYEALGNLDAAERDRAAAVEIRSKR